MRASAVDRALTQVDDPRGIFIDVFDQAENRLHAQKALLCLLMGAESWS